jgi:hypothetical protein
VWSEYPGTEDLEDAAAAQTESRVSVLKFWVIEFLAKVKWRLTATKKGLSGKIPEQPLGFLYVTWTASGRQARTG